MVVNLNWIGGNIRELIEDYVSDFLPNLLLAGIAVTILAFSIYGIIVIGNNIDSQPIQEIIMDNGVICYTFNSDISCLQVDK